MGKHPYQGKLSILQSLTPLAEKMQAVRIESGAILDFAAQIDAASFPRPRWDCYFVPAALDEVAVDYFLLFNSLNFCYWGSPKWTVEYRGQRLDGAWGMLAALTRALEEKIPIYEGEYLASISLKDLAHILRGEGEIPLLYPRFLICREIGRVLRDEFQGRFYHLLERAEGDAVNLVRLLVTHLPSFDDSADWNGGRLLFYKRAQLAAAILYERWQGQGPGNLDRIAEMTASADYKLPQILRRLGILEYSSELGNLVDQQRQIPAGSREELEIRTATLVACEMIREQIQDRLPNVTSQSVDRMLWYATQSNRSPEHKPYHLTLTTAY